jgi:hypothetical protein
MRVVTRTRDHERDHTSGDEREAQILHEDGGRRDHSGGRDHEVPARPACILEEQHEPENQDCEQRLRPHHVGGAQDRR